jgi:alcohol dehydrogenase class IV
MPAHAGMAFSNVGVAMVHALEYPIGAATHCSHGAGNGLLLPHVMRYNLPARTKEFARIAELLGVDIDGLSQLHAAECAVGAVEKLNQRIGVPARLRDLGAKSEQIPDFAEKAMGITRIVRVNPRVPTVADMVELLNQAY